MDFKKKKNHPRNSWAGIACELVFLRLFPAFNAKKIKAVGIKIQGRGGNNLQHSVYGAEDVLICSSCFAAPEGCRWMIFSQLQTSSAFDVANWEPGPQTTFTKTLNCIISQRKADCLRMIFVPARYCLQVLQNEFEAQSYKEQLFKKLNFIKINHGVQYQKTLVRPGKEHLLLYSKANKHKDRRSEGCQRAGPSGTRRGQSGGDAPSLYWLSLETARKKLGQRQLWTNCKITSHTRIDLWHRTEDFIWSHSQRERDYDSELSSFF